MYKRQLLYYTYGGFSSGIPEFHVYGVTALCRVTLSLIHISLKADLEQIQQECRKEHWLFSINHPFLYIWKWLYGDLRLDGVHCLEIINDPTYEADPEAKAGKANQRAVSYTHLKREQNQ